MYGRSLLDRCFLRWARICSISLHSRRKGSYPEVCVRSGSERVRNLKPDRGVEGRSRTGSALVVCNLWPIPQRPARQVFVQVSAFIACIAGSGGALVYNSPESVAFSTDHTALGSFVRSGLPPSSVPNMFRCGIAYNRCRWILPLLLLFAIIFDIIAIAATSGWVEDENAQTHYASMWNQCRGRNDNWDCKSLMEYPWAQAVAALMILGLFFLIVAFIISCPALCCSVNISLLPVIGALLIIAVILQVIALIIYPVKFNELIYEGHYFYTWAYGFGWGATLLMIGCSVLFCCLPNYEDEITGLAKTKYIYNSA